MDTNSDTPSAPTRPSRFRKAGLLVTIALVVFLLACSGWTLSFANSVNRELARTEDSRLAKELASRSPNEPVRLLLVGVDRRPDSTGARSDTMLLLQIDAATGQAWLVSLPRDLRVDIDGYGASKLNGAYARGGPSLTVKTVANLLELPIHHYVEMDFMGFQRAVDMIGGVWIHVPDDIDDWRAASASPGKRASRIPAGYQLLDGEHALTFVRTRHYRDGDFTRMNNQRVFIHALLSQATKPRNMLRLPRAIRQLSSYVVTDMRVADLVPLAWATRTLQADTFYSVTIPGTWRSPFVWPDEEGMSRIVGALKSTSPIDIDSSGLSITIANGTDREGIALEAARLLESQGFNIDRLGEATWMKNRETIVVYESMDRHHAGAVAAVLPVSRLVEGKGRYSFTTRILVVVGSDWPTETGSPTSLETE